MAMHEEGNHRLEVSPLLRAVILDLPSTVKHVLAAGVDADIRYEYGNGDITALEAATLLQYVGVVRVLIEHGVEVNGIGVGGRTVLQNAVMNDGVDPDLIDLLLSAGADIDARTAEGSTALHMATEWPGDITAVLLHRGLDTHALDNEGRSPLHLAARYGNPAATRALLAAGADATLRIDREDCKFSPLDVAAQYGQVEVIKELARHGVDMNATQFACYGSLHHAASTNQACAIDALIEAGASIDAQTSLGAGTTPLHSAITTLALEAMHALLRHGAPVLALPVPEPQEDGTGSRTRSPLHAAARLCGQEGSAKMVDLLLRWGADESELDGIGITAAEYIRLYAQLLYSLRLQSLSVNTKRMLELLVNARFDRVWRRRGLLLLCLARNKRMTRRRGSGIGSGGKGKGKEAEGWAFATDGGASGSGGGTVSPRANVGVSAATAGKCKCERTPSKLGGRRAKFGGVSGSGCNGDGGGGVLLNGDDFDGVVAFLLEFVEEGFFRTIVGYL